ncbi:VWA domain-containing protein [Novosphingobium sp.]|uniref:VWA domain-containing protein n=1 Tax=Novosphingobium sp. TaxID=1874826 RepID=UPI0038BA4984
MSPGEKRAVSDLTFSRKIDVTVRHAPDDIDIVAFGLNAERKIADDRYTVLFSNERSPEGAISYCRITGATTITVYLDLLPVSVDRISLVASHDTMALKQARQLSVDFAGVATVEPLSALGDEKAVMLLDLYRHNGVWRLGVVVQGFSGGLADLVRHLGGDVDESPAAAPPPPPLSLSKVDLRKQKVGVSLKKLGIEHEKAEVVFVIDATGSMSTLYRNGTVQETIERIVPVSLRLDDDGIMPTWFYASGCARTEDLTAKNYEGYVPRTLPSPMKPVIGVQKHSCAAIDRKGEVTIGGVNNEIVILNALLDDEPANRTTPLLVIFMTDGGFAPSKEIAKIITNAAPRPIFWQFVGVGNNNFGMLRNLDTLPGRVVDNAGFFPVTDLAKITDEELYDRLLSEFPAWLKAVRAKGILPAR